MNRSTNAITTMTKTTESKISPTPRTKPTTMILLGPKKEQDLDHDLTSSSSTADHATATTTTTTTTTTGGNNGAGDAASLVTESSSEAVVSLFNCWSSFEEASPFHGVPKDSSNPRDHHHGPIQELAGLTVSIVPPPPASIITTTTATTIAMSPEEVLQRLTKRLRPDDMPTIPVLKRRKRPTCCFINYLDPARLRDHHAKCGRSATNLLVRPPPRPAASSMVVATGPCDTNSTSAATTAVLASAGTASDRTYQEQEQYEPIDVMGIKWSQENNDNDVDRLFVEVGPFSRSPDLGAAFSPADAELEELDLLGPLFADDEHDDDNNNNEMLFSPTAILSMSTKASFPLVVGGGGCGDDDDNNNMVDVLDLQIMAR